MMNGNEKKKSTTLTDTEKVTLAKKLLLACIAVILIMSFILYLNYTELKKYETISAGEYITTDQCTLLHANVSLFKNSTTLFVLTPGAEERTGSQGIRAWTE